MKRKIMAMVISCVLVVSLCSCGSKNVRISDNQTSVTADSKESVSSSTTNKTEEKAEYILPSKYEDMSVEEIVASLSLDQKAAQMVQGAVYNIGTNDMNQYDYESWSSAVKRIAVKLSKDGEPDPYDNSYLANYPKTNVPYE